MALNSGDAAIRRKRGGRPSAEQAGEVDRRILDAATTLFLRAGFDGTSCDQVLALAGAGKATLYARYANKDALFSAVVHRMVEQRTLPVAEIPEDMPVRERLRLVGSSLLQHALTEESIGLMRICIATAQRLPELSRMVDRQAHHSAVAHMVRALAGDIPAPGKAQPATAIAERFIDMVLLPRQMRALTGGDPAPLDATAPSSVEDAVDLLDRAGLLDALGRVQDA